MVVTVMIEVTEVSIAPGEFNCSLVKAAALPWHGQGCHYVPAEEPFDDWQNLSDVVITTPIGTFPGSLFIHMLGTNNSASIASDIGATGAFVNGAIAFSPVVPGEYVEEECPEAFFSEVGAEGEVEA